MKNKKETAPTTEKERENFWLEIGPASAYYGKIGLKSLHDIPPDFCYFATRQTKGSSPVQKDDCESVSTAPLWVKQYNRVEVREI